MMLDGPMDMFPIVCIRDKEARLTAWAKPAPSITKAAPTVEVMPSLNERFKPRLPHAPPGWPCQVYAPNRSTSFGNIKTADMVNTVLQQVVRESLQYGLDDKLDPVSLTAAALDPTLSLADFHMYQMLLPNMTGYEPLATITPHTEEAAKQLKAAGYIKLHTLAGETLTIFTAEAPAPPHSLAIGLRQITEAGLKEVLTIISKMHCLGHTKQVRNRLHIYAYANASHEHHHMNKLRPQTDTNCPPKHTNQKKHLRPRDTDTNDPLHHPHPLPQCTPQATIIREAGLPLPEEEQPRAALISRYGELQLIDTQEVGALQADGHEDINGFFLDMRGQRLPPTMGPNAKGHVLLALADAPTLAAVLQGVAALGEQPMVLGDPLDISIPSLDSDKGTFKPGPRLSSIPPEDANPPVDTAWTAGTDGTLATMEALVATLDPRLTDSIKGESKLDFTWQLSLDGLLTSNRVLLAQQAIKGHEVTANQPPPPVVKTLWQRIQAARAAAGGTQAAQDHMEVEATAPNNVNRVAQAQRQMFGSPTAVTTPPPPSDHCGSRWK
jgi:hypothetical protein